LRDESEIRDKFASSREVSGNLDARKFGMLAPCHRDGVLHQCGGSVQMKAGFAACRYREVLENFGLERSAIRCAGAQSGPRAATNRAERPML
jgi:hypothetical protein